MNHHDRNSKIYLTRVHRLVTIGVVALPFFFLLMFSRVFGIPQGILLNDLGVSAFRIGVAYVIAAVLAWVCAVLFYRGKASTIGLPVFDVLQSFPTFALLPLSTYVWGVSHRTIIFFLVLTIIWPIFFSIISSLKLVKHEWHEAASVFGLSGNNYFVKFLLPVSLPGLITGSIIGLGEGWEALIATEIVVGSPSGLGSFFQTYSHNLTVTMFGILGFLLLVFSINKVIWLALLDWSHRTMEE